MAKKKYNNCLRHRRTNVTYW